MIPIHKINDKLIANLAFLFEHPEHIGLEDFYGSLETALKLLETGDFQQAKKVLDHLKNSPGYNDNARAVYAFISLLSLVEEAKLEGSVFETFLSQMGLTVIGDLMQEWQIEDLSEETKINPDDLSSSDVQPVNEALLARIDEVLLIIDGIEDPNSVNIQIHNRELDYGDVLLAQTGLLYTKTVLAFNRAYQIDYQSYDSACPDEETSPLNLKDFTLTSDADQYLSIAKTSFSQTLDSFIATVNWVKQETDDQSNDLFYLDEEGQLDTSLMIKTLTDMEASITTPGYYPIRIFELSQDPNSVDITTSDGQVYLDSNKVVLKGYLRADLSQFFDHPFDGSLLAEDASYEVTEVPVQNDYETWCEHIVHFDPNEYLGGFIKGVLADCSIVDQEVMVEGNPYQATKVIPKLAADQNGDTLLTEPETGLPLSLEEAWEAGLLNPSSTIPISQLVALELPLMDGNSITIDGSADDWAGATRIELDQARVAMAKSEDTLYILLESDLLGSHDEYNLNMSFSRESFGSDGYDFPDWAFCINASVGSEYPWMNVSGNYLRNCWEEMLSSDHMAYQGTVIELAVPLSHLAQFTDGPIYLNHLDMVGFSFGNIYDESDWSGDDWCDEDYYLVYWDAWDDLFMEDFWGYRVDLGNLSCESITPGDPCAATPESVEKMTQTAVDMLGSAGSMEELLAYAQGLLTEQLTFDNPQRRLEFDPIPPQDFACGTFSQTIILGGLDFTFTLECTACEKCTG